MIGFFSPQKDGNQLTAGGQKRDFVVIRDDIYEDGGGERGYMV